MSGRLTLALLTGFLGSGKTSLLNRLLRRPELRDSAVLVNEFGEVGLDHHLLRPLDGETVLLPSGCVCCTVRAELRDALLDLHDRRARGLLPPFRRVILETTGLADPAPIAQTLSADPRLRYHYALGRIVTTVDALTGPATLLAHEEAVHQIAVADLLALTKLDLAPDSAAFERQLAALNPTAALAHIAPDDDTTLAPVLEALLAGPDEHRLHVWPESHDHAAHSGITSVCLTTDRPLDWAAFALWFTLLLHRHGQTILRSKGLLQLKGVATPVVVHGVQHVVHRPSHLAEWPEGRAGTRLVLIGKGLDRERLERSFRVFVDAGKGPPAS